MPVACTIIARNYLPTARVIYASFAAVHPDVDFVVLLIDERDAAQRALDEIHASVAWRLVAVSRRVAAALLPPGSRRRSLFDSVLHTIGRRLPPVRRVSSIVED